MTTLVVNDKMIIRINRKIVKTRVSVINQKDKGGEKLESSILYWNKLKYILEQCFMIKRIVRCGVGRLSVREEGVWGKQCVGERKGEASF